MQKKQNNQQNYDKLLLIIRKQCVTICYSLWEKFPYLLRKFDILT